MIGVYFCPESPRWLMKKGKIAKGFQSMAKLRAHPIIGARDYYYSFVQYQEEVKVAGGLGYFQRLWDCFSVPRIRRANYGASTVMLAQQLCGINSEYYICFPYLTASNDFQSSPSTAPPSSAKPVTASKRLSTPPSATALSKSSSQSPPFSSSTQRAAEGSVSSPSP